MNGRHFLHVFSTFDPGGLEVRSAMVMDLLGPPHRHTIVAMSGCTGAAQRVRNAAIDIQPPPSTRVFAATAAAMARRIRALRPDLVLTYNWGAIESVAACRLAQHAALIHHEEGFGAGEVERLLRRRSWARRILLRGASRVVVPSRGLARIAREVWRVPAERVRHLVNGVDLQRFAPPPARQGDRSGGVVIGSVAHFRPEKSVPTLIEAFARCRHAERARLLLVGAGPQLELAQRLAVELGVAERVEFRGPIADTAPIYHEIDVFALSSRTEQMPLVVLEAMASGLPVVAPDVGDVTQMIAPANVPLVAARGDLDALAACLDRAIESPELRAELGAANRAVCEERYELGKCLRAHLDLYAEVLQGEVLPS